MCRNRKASCSTIHSLLFTNLRLQNSTKDDTPLLLKAKETTPAGDLAVQFPVWERRGDDKSETNNHQAGSGYKENELKPKHERERRQR